MIGRPGLSAHRGVRAAMIALPILLLALAIPLETSPPVHLHKAGSAGLYNEDHVLRSLDSVLGDLPLPDARWAAFIALLTGATLATGGGRLSAAAFALADSRAPPFA